MANQSTGSTARLLMTATGFTTNVVGTAMNAVGTLYANGAVYDFGRAVNECLPEIMAATASRESVAKLFGDRVGGWPTIGVCVAVIGAGTLVKKLGAALSNEATIGRVERFVYGKTFAVEKAE